MTTNQPTMTLELDWYDLITIRSALMEQKYEFDALSDERQEMAALQNDIHDLAMNIDDIDSGVAMLVVEDESESDDWEMPDGYDTMRDFAFGPSGDDAESESEAEVKVDGGKKVVPNYGKLV